MFVGGLFTVFTLCKELMYICMFVYFYRKIMLLCFLFNVYSCVYNCIKHSWCLSKKKKLFFTIFYYFVLSKQIITVKFSFLLFTADG